jgi:hypothetical protein
VLKSNEFRNLDTLAQVMVEKREKEQQLSEVEEQFRLALEDLRSVKLAN